MGNGIHHLYVSLKHQILAKTQSTPTPSPQMAHAVRTSATRENFSVKLKENHCAPILR